VCAGAHAGQDAVEKAQRLRPDLIVLDLSMPLTQLDLGSVSAVSDPGLLNRGSSLAQSAASNGVTMRLFRG
jgi:CheY-like chemotaxis protein